MRTETSKFIFKTFIQLQLSPMENFKTHWSIFVLLRRGFDYWTPPISNIRHFLLTVSGFSVSKGLKVDSKRENSLTKFSGSFCWCRSERGSWTGMSRPLSNPEIKKKLLTFLPTVYLIINFFLLLNCISHFYLRYYPVEVWKMFYK